MKRKFQKMFALSDQGINDLWKACKTAFLTYVTGMLPACVLMLYLEMMLEQQMVNAKSLWMFALAAIIIEAFALRIHYDSLYTATYQESANLRINIANRMKQLPLSYYAKHDVADMSQVIMADVEAIEHALSHAIPNAFGFMAFAILLAVGLLIGNVKLGLVVLIPIFASGLLLRLSKDLQIKVTSFYHQRLRAISNSFQSAIELQQEIRNYGLQEKYREKLYQEVKEQEKIHLDCEIKEVLPVMFSELLLVFSIGLCVFIGNQMLQNHEISLLYFVGYLLASVKLVEGFTMIDQFVAEILYINARVKRVEEVVNYPIEQGQDLKIDEPSFVLDHVSFGYHDQNVINDISLTIQKGKITAFVGPSGCGKTTLLRLLAKLYDYQEGSIHVGDVDLSKIASESYYKNVSIVFQDVMLFDGSILENIRIGNKHASDQEVLEAAKLAGCDFFVQKLPEGYQTVIGENGSRLSGGERQRISIARAFLKDAPIILLDEIASALDVENEMYIQESLQKLMKGKTVIIISHRMKSIENADQIVVLKDGSIDAMGTHDELLKTSDLYQLMVNRFQQAEEFVY